MWVGWLYLLAKDTLQQSLGLADDLLSRLIAGSFLALAGAIWVG